jgi:hypothetical protein
VSPPPQSVRIPLLKRAKTILLLRTYDGPTQKPSRFCVTPFASALPIQRGSRPMPPAWQSDQPTRRGKSPTLRCFRIFILTRSASPTMPQGVVVWPRILNGKSPMLRIFDVSTQRTAFGMPPNAPRKLRGRVSYAPVMWERTFRT